jgi:MFS family permease
MSASELGLVLVAFLTGLSFAVVAPVLPLQVEAFGISYEMLGLFFSAYSLTWGFLQLYTGYLSDRYGRRRFALIGLAIHSLVLTSLPLIITMIEAHGYIDFFLSQRTS